MGRSNSFLFLRPVSLIQAATFLFADVACSAPASANALALQTKHCLAESGSSSLMALSLATNSGSYRFRETVRCPGNQFSFAPIDRSIADFSKEQDNPSSAAPQPRFSAAEHRFWDRKNDLLFAAVGASRTLDYFSTLNFRRRGRDEVFLTNDIVDNHAAFAAIEAGGTAVSIGVSYLFHRYHHHRLERWTSIVHASLATSGAVRNYCLKTAHP